MATDLADYLVQKGLPFRQAHALAGQAVHLAGEQGKSLEALSVEEFLSFSPAFDADVYAVFDPQRSVARRNVVGGTAPAAVKKQIQNAKSILRKAKAD
jgi:argininosuccinate lyase